jgi:hypothetical protein
MRSAEGFCGPPRAAQILDSEKREPSPSFGEMFHFSVASARKEDTIT